MRNANLGGGVHASLARKKGVGGGVLLVSTRLFFLNSSFTICQSPMILEFICRGAPHYLNAHISVWNSLVTAPSGIVTVNSFFSETLKA